MKKIFKNQIAASILLSTLILTSGIIIYGFINKGKSKNENKLALLESVINGDKYFQGNAFKDEQYILGNRKNDITLIVYSDLECPFCQILQENVVKQLQKKYILDPKDPSKAKIGIVYRHFAQSYHTKAPAEINASLCVRELYGQNTYINFINKIYDVSPSNNGLDLALLPSIAKDVIDQTKADNMLVKKEFDLKDFTNCFNNNTYNEEFLADSNDAINAGLEGTPFSVLLYRNGASQVIVQKISGARDFNYFDTLIQKLLKI